MAEGGRFTPVPRDSTPALIAAQLREAIKDGRLAPGAQLSEGQLATQFGVSRGPLREAMQRLVQEGLLHSERNRGLFVRVLDARDIEDVYLARSAIESAAAVLLARHRGDGEHGDLRAVCAEMAHAARTGDMVGVSDADLRFHEVLVARAGSPRLIRMHQTLIVETRMCMTALQDTYRLPDDLVEEHLGIVDAVQSGDEALLLRRIEEHMQDALARLAVGPEAARPPVL
jgi:DNA-binding GntR family transcriptional regulator